MSVNQTYNFTLHGDSEVAKFGIQLEENHLYNLIINSPNDDVNSGIVVSGSSGVIEDRHFRNLDRFLLHGYKYTYIKISNLIIDDSTQKTYSLRIEELSMEQNNDMMSTAIQLVIALVIVISVIISALYIYKRGLCQLISKQNPTDSTDIEIQKGTNKSYEQMPFKQSQISSENEKNAALEETNKNDDFSKTFKNEETDIDKSSPSEAIDKIGNFSKITENKSKDLKSEFLKIDTTEADDLVRGLSKIELENPPQNDAKQIDFKKIKLLTDMTTDEIWNSHRNRPKLQTATPTDELKNPFKFGSEPIVKNSADNSKSDENQLKAGEDRSSILIWEAREAYKQNQRSIHYKTQDSMEDSISVDSSNSELPSKENTDSELPSKRPFLLKPPTLKLEKNQESEKNKEDPDMDELCGTLAKF